MKFHTHADKLKRLSMPALLCVCCICLSGCAWPRPADSIGLVLHVNDASAPPQLRMIPTRTEHGRVYRAILLDLNKPMWVALHDGDAQYTLRVEPHHGYAVVEYRPGTGRTMQLSGSWHLFSYRPQEDIRPQSVHLAGSFNGWSTHALPMFDRGGGEYVALLKLPEGVHWYKFVVDGDTWINDPASDKEFEQPDGNYGVNSAVLVGVDARGLPAPEPNHIETSAVIHDPGDVPDRAAASATLLRLSIRVQADDVEHVTAMIQSERDGSDWKRYALQPCGEHVGLERYGALVQLPGGPVRYVFELVDGKAKRYWSSSGPAKSLRKAQRSAYQCPMQPGFVTPDWAKDAVWYQVFPERFRNGDEANDPQDIQRWQADWWATLPGEQAGEDNFYRGHGNVWRRRFGGDIQGAREALPYLRKLGVNTLYLNPIFEAPSMHKYDTSDFRHIEDNFTVKHDPALLAGETDDPKTWQWSPGDRVFLDFIEEAHRQGFKVVIDGVFNHVGEWHYAFRDVLEHGKDSRYADWFEIIDWGQGGEPGEPGGIQWRGWDHDNGQMPLLKKDPVLGLAEGPRQHIFDITRRWMAPNGDPGKGIDGWRLDVAPDIPHPFWIAWRKHVKSINPDAIITGEVWTWAQPWLQGDQFDASMNYQFAIPAQDFFVDQQTRISPTDFSTRLNQLVYAYPLQAALVMQNLFDSHDTDRLASMFVNPDRGYDTSNRLQDTGPDYSLDKPNDVQRLRMKQALVCQMTFVGAPMIYYGTEAGMWGPDDPNNRMPMIWRDLLPYDDPTVTFDEDMFAWYQRLVALRRGLPALRRGFFRTLIADDETGVLAYARDLDNDHVYIVINRSDEPRQVTLDLARSGRGVELIDWLDPSQARVEAGGPSSGPASRPKLVAKEDVGGDNTYNGSVIVMVPAYGSAVISDRRQMQQNPRQHVFSRVGDR